MKTTKDRYFLVFSPNSSAGIIGITDNEEFAKSMQDVFTDYKKVKFLNPSQWRIAKVKEIATNYHDRVNGNMLTMDGQKCQCCGQIVRSTTSIEHDSQDFTKDLSVCIVDCYQEIVSFWKANSPNKRALDNRNEDFQK